MQWRDHRCRAIVSRDQNALACAVVYNNGIAGIVPLVEIHMYIPLVKIGIYSNVGVQRKAVMFLQQPFFFFHFQIFVPFIIYHGIITPNLITALKPNQFFVIAFFEVCVCKMVITITQDDVSFDKGIITFLYYCLVHNTLLGMFC